MPIMQEDRKLRSNRFALRRHRLLEEMVLHLLRQGAPYPNNRLTQGARKLLHAHAVAGIGGWHPSYSRNRNRSPRPTVSWASHSNDIAGAPAYSPRATRLVPRFNVIERVRVPAPFWPPVLAAISPNPPPETPAARPIPALIAPSTCSAPASATTPRKANKLKSAKQPKGTASASNSSRFMA